MKKPSNKAKAIYLVWVLIHITMLVLAKQAHNNLNSYGFYPFGYKPDYDNQYVTKPFKIDYVYDFSELIFYTIAPISIYYIIRLFKTIDEDKIHQ
jgi:hypothetical protein